MLFVSRMPLDQLGIDTTSLVAILGAAGLAIGLPLQGSLQLCCGSHAFGLLSIQSRRFCRRCRGFRLSCKYWYIYDHHEHA